MNEATGLDHWMARLGDADAGVRREAAEALARLGSAATPALVGALDGGRAALCHGAALALGLLCDPAALGALVRALEHPVWYVREAAAASIGRLGDVRAVAALAGALEDPEPPVRRAAAGALGAIGGRAAARVLAPLVQDEERSVRRAAVDALAAMGGPAAVRPLTEALDDPTLAPVAAEALGRMGWDARPALERLRLCLRLEWRHEAAACYREAIRRIDASTAEPATELEWAPPPAGSGTELESAPPPAGRGTELEAGQAAGEVEPL